MTKKEIFKQSLKFNTVLSFSGKENTFYYESNSFLPYNLYSSIVNNGYFLVENQKKYLNSYKKKTLAKS